jgi:CheY-like chemotaxis protein
MPETSPPRRAYSGVRPRGPLVLVAETEDSLREQYAAELAAAGFMVLEAEDGATAIEKAFQFGPHAVVFDLMMVASIDGLKVARRLRGDERTHELTLIGLSASSRFEDLALAAGCDAFFEKPIASAVLIGEIVRQIAKRAKVGNSSPDLSKIAGER